MFEIFLKLNLTLKFISHKIHSTDVQTSSSSCLRASQSVTDNFLKTTCVALAFDQEALKINYRHCTAEMSAKHENSIFQCQTTRENSGKRRGEREKKIFCE